MAVMVTVTERWAPLTANEFGSIKHADESAYRPSGIQPAVADRSAVQDAFT